MEREINLGFFFKSLKKCWYIMIIVAVAAAITVGVLASFLPKTYSSSVTFYARNNDVNEDVVNQSSLSATAQLIDDYTKLIMEGDDVLLKISEEMKNTYGVEITPSAISGMLSASVGENSSMFKIKVSSKDPELAYQVACAIETVAPQAVTEIAKRGYLTTEYISGQVAEVVRRIGKVEGLDWYIDKPNNYDAMIQIYIQKLTEEDPSAANITVEQVKSIIGQMEQEDSFRYTLDEPDNFAELIEKYLNENTSLLKDTSLCFTSVKRPIKDTSADSPNVLRYAAIGGAVGAILVYLIFFIKGLLEVNISSEEELKRLVKRPIIGTIPSWETTSKM